MSFKRWQTAAARRSHRKAMAKYQAKPEEVKKRVARNKARREAIREGRAKVGDGKDVNHVNGDATDNSKGNTRVQDRGDNRSFPRNKDGSKKNKND